MAQGAATSSIGVKLTHVQGKPKRTSQGLRTPPLNKHKRRSWKAYRGQGRPR